MSSEGSFVEFPHRWLLPSINKNEQEEEEGRAGEERNKQVHVHKMFS